MSDPSPSTPSETTGEPAPSQPTTSPTSSTTPPTAEAATPPSSEPSDKSILNTEPAKSDPPSDAKADGKAEDKPAVPEKYADFTLPEGVTVQPEVMEKATAAFRKMNLTQEQAQELVTLQAENIKQLATQNRQAYRDMRDGWVKSVRENPKFANEFGADGKLKPDSKTLVGLGRVLDSLGNKQLTNDFRQALDLTGAGDHPAFFEVFSMLAERLAEGAPVRGNAPSPHGQTATGAVQRRSPAQEIFPNLPSAGA